MILKLIPVSLKETSTCVSVCDSPDKVYDSLR